MRKIVDGAIYEKARDFSRGQRFPVFLWKNLTGTFDYGFVFINDGSVLIAKFVDGIDLLDGV